MSEETIVAWSGIQQSITNQAINQWQNRIMRVSKPKANICCYVLIGHDVYYMHGGDSGCRCNGSITVVINSLTHCFTR